MMHSSDEDIELCSIDRFGLIETNFLHKNIKLKTFYQNKKKNKNEIDQNLKFYIK